MIANELLLWMSARCEGSWQQFRAAVDELRASFEDNANDDEMGEFPTHQRLRQSLDCLGHTEFFAQECEGGWRVAPPTLAVRKAGSQVIGFLCGARSTELLQRVGAITDQCRVEQTELFAAPDRVCVLAESDESVVRLARVAGLHVQYDAPLAILMHIPGIKQPGRASGDEIPVGADWLIHEFNARDLRWGEVTREHCERARRGLFRFRDRFQTRLYFTRDEAATQKVGRGVGIFQALRGVRRWVLSYSRERAELRLPAICRPPRLVERPLVLCSGRPASYDTSAPQPQICYHEVTADTAALAAELLRQPLQ